MKLFDLTSAYQNLLDLAAEGEDFEAALDELRGTIEEKAESYAFVIKTLEAEADAINEEAKKLLAKAQYRINAAKRLKDHLQTGLEAAGIDKVKGNIYTVALQNSPPSVEVIDMVKVSMAWKVEHITESVDKKAVIQAWQDGGYDLDGLTVKQGKHLRIR